MVAGSGPPLFLIDQFFDLGLDLRVQAATAAPFLQGLAASRTIIFFDWRNFGLSGASKDFSMETCVSDIESIVLNAGLTRFDLWSRARAANVALEFAALHPELVRKFVIGLPYPPRVALAGLREATRAVAGLVTSDWDSFTNEFALGLYGWTEAGKVYAEQLRWNWTPDTFMAFDAVVSQFDGFRSARLIKAPALIIEREEDDESIRRAARRLAALLPNSHLVISRIGTVRDPAMVPIIESFLGEWDEVAAKPETPLLPEGAVVILFTDIVESTALTERLGDAAFRTRARDLDASLRTLVRENGGTPVEGTLLGDGLLAVFTSARQAIDCALKSNAAAESAGLQLHLGLHAGDVLREGNNVYGGAVNIAARIMGLTAPGQVLVSDTVRSLARTSAGVTFADQGEHTLKGIADPVRVFQVTKADAIV
jgi:class 3 adenylate cyclase/pimeloyl-ACP methyl ester carboxylesterase